MSFSEYEMAIVNASPLICLARAGLLELLFRTFQDVQIPRPVFDEVMAGPEHDPAREFLQNADAFSVIDPRTTSDLVREWDLGAGETSVLTGVLEEAAAIAVIDDAAARKCARTLGMPYCGSLGVLARARAAGVLVDLNACVSSLREAGVYLSDGDRKSTRLNSSHYS